MQSLRVSFTQPGTDTRRELDVPDVTTALVVAQINSAGGQAELKSDDRVIARLERQGRTLAPFWHVS
ncbi:MAG: hypothetical protein WBA68_06750 [Alteraurantiacibacter sp.]